MSSKSNYLITLILVLFSGVLLGVVGFKLILEPNEAMTSANSDAQQAQPLYWVAPMDDNYRRDKPGLSPMGMDLVPVYADDSASLSPGTVTISAHVINNLGVRTAPVVIRDMHSEISAVGYVKYDEDKLIHIHPRVDGWIEKLYVKSAGDPVTKGQALYTLYSPQLVNAQEEFLIALKRSNRALITAAKERLSALQLSSRFIAQLEKTKKVSQSITFYSPQSGVVDGLKIREGFYVKPGNTLLSIAQLEHIWVEAEVFERDSALIKEGLAVTMSLDYVPGERWLGKVDYVYPSLNSKTRTLRVRLKFDNADFKLKPNMFAQVTIHAEPVKQAMLVPKESVIRTGEQDRVVLALGQGQFKSVEVSIGRVDSEYIEILQGLSDDNIVVTSAQFLIDSESSKNSDFIRMSKNDEPASGHVMPDAQVDRATVDGLINVIDVDNRSINISRSAIKKWQRAAATMDFILSDEVDISQFKQGDKVNFTFEVRDELLIVDMALMTAINGDEHVKSSEHQMEEEQ